MKEEKRSYFLLAGDERMAVLYDVWLKKGRRAYLSAVGQEKREGRIHRCTYLPTLCLCRGNRASRLDQVASLFPSLCMAKRACCLPDKKRLLVRLAA